MSAPTSAHAEARDSLDALGAALARLAAEWWRANGERIPPDPPTPDDETATAATVAVSGTEGR
jgi:hypothetical protein